MAQGGPGGSTIDTSVPFFQLGYYPALETLRADAISCCMTKAGRCMHSPRFCVPKNCRTHSIRLNEKFLLKKMRARQRGSPGMPEASCERRRQPGGVQQHRNALDIEDVRRVLGYDKFDFYGVSTGHCSLCTDYRNARNVSQRDPRRGRSDRTQPQSCRRPIAAARVRAIVFHLRRRCGLQSSVPNLKQVFYGVVDSMNKNPARAI